MKILVIQQKMIGDVLTSSILFEALREKYPNAQLDYLINSHTFPVVENNPFITNFIHFSPEVEKSKRKLFKLAKSIKKNKYDVVIDVYSKLSSNIITLFSGAKTKISYHKSYTTFVYTHNIKRLTSTSNPAGLAIVNRLQLLEPLGIDIENIKPKIYITQQEKETSKAFLKSYNIDFKKPLFMISVLGSGENKTYPFHHMAKVIDLIVSQTQGQILFNYIPKQEPEAKAIFDLCKTNTQNHIYFNVYGKSLRDFLAITTHCNALIGNEGGAVNMAKALNIKTFTIFSPWIDKDTWSVFEDDSNNVSVHLKDYKPDLYANKTEKEMKPQAMSLYQEFNPDFFEKQLISFLKHIY
ncbi:glycosyltransferase family 9 protein [Corallibacter vietnamensis]|uniref:Glycosyltransferase family 9 protein n=1 Tax=Corallibacter vietnamensis TaxID=904130 RepID=A0ABP7H2H9_9FLAO